MVFITVRLLSGKTKCITLSENININYVLDKCCQVEDKDSVYLLHNGLRLGAEDVVQDGQVYQMAARLPGGKGGFGSMLRAIGAQIEKTISKEACRDLSGRRMRDINNEKKLREWVSKQAEREKEKAEKRRERMERRKSGPRHNFDDPDYEKQKTIVTENLEDALQHGLQKAAAAKGSSAASSRKRKAADRLPEEIKKQCQWLGIDVENLSDLSGGDDSDEDEDDEDSDLSSVEMEAFTNTFKVSSAAQPGPSSSHVAVTHQINDKVTSSLSKDEQKTDTTNENLASLSTKEKPSDISSADSTSNSKSMLGNRDPESTTSKQDTTTECAVEISKEKINQESGPLNLDQYDSVEALEALGLDRLKSALMALGLKCGGTLQERAHRLYSVKGLTREQYNPALFAKPSKGKKK